MALAQPGHLHLPGTWVMQQLLRAHFWVMIFPETGSWWDKGCWSCPPITLPLPCRLQWRTGGWPGILALLQVGDDGMAQVLNGGAGIYRGTGCQRGQSWGKPVPWAEPRGAAQSFPPRLSKVSTHGECRQQGPLHLG